jgi:hypothetical protein
MKIKSYMLVAVPRNTQQHNERHPLPSVKLLCPPLPLSKSSGSVQTKVKLLKKKSLMLDELPPCPVPYIWFETAASSSSALYSMMTMKMGEGVPLCSLCCRHVTNHLMQHQLASDMPKSPSPEHIISNETISDTPCSSQIKRHKFVTRLIQLERFYQLFKRHGSQPPTSRKKGTITTSCTGLTTIDCTRKCFLHLSLQEQRKILGVNLDRCSIRSLYYVACAVEGLHLQADISQGSWLLTAKSIIRKHFSDYPSDDIPSTVSLKVLREVS